MIPGVPTDLTLVVNSNLNGAQIFEVVHDASDADGYLSLRVASTSDTESISTIEMLVNAEEGFSIRQLDAILQLTDGIAGFGVGVYTVQATAVGYSVGDPSAFRAAIGIQETFGEYLEAIAATTSDPGIVNKPWNDNGTFKFSTGAFSTYFRPDGFSQVFRPDGVSLYLRP